ncbi:MAG: arginase family protein, partial [Nitrososphaerota archaeon]|nr:arginase family protein [Nitrososphaerota archaeon]
MRKAAAYPEPSYHDPADKRMVEIIGKAARPMTGAVNILGIPFEGAVLGRKGAAGGPSAIRQSMSSFSNFNVELREDVSRAKVFDLGNLAVAKGEEVRRAHSLIETEVAKDL